MPPAAAPPMPTAAHMVLVLVTFTLLAAMATAWALAIARLVAKKPLLPARGPRVVPWGVGSLLAVVLLYFAVNLAIGAAYLAATGGARMSSRSILAMMALCNAALLPLVPLALRLTAGARLSDLGLDVETAWADALRGAVACLLLAPVVYALMAAVGQVWKPHKHPMEDMIKAAPTGSIALLAFVSGVILAPAAEELIFRGVLQGWLVRACSRKPAADPFAEGGDLPDDRPILLEEYAVSAEEGALRTAWSAPIATLERASRPGGAAVARYLPGVVTSLLFAALHWQQWPAPIPLFVLSLALGALYERTGGLVAPFVLHATFNGLSTTLMYLALLAGGKAPAPVPPSPPKPPAVAPPGRLSETAPWRGPWESV